MKHSTFNIQHQTPNVSRRSRSLDVECWRLNVECFPSPIFRMAAILFIILSLNSPLPAQETQRQYLSGHGKDDAVPWEFMCTSGANSGFWTNLPVPSQWDMHGFGTLSYHKDATNALDEKGLYGHNFTVPKK